MTFWLWMLLAGAAGVAGPLLFRSRPYLASAIVIVAPPVLMCLIFVRSVIGDGWGALGLAIASVSWAVVASAGAALALLCLPEAPTDESAGPEAPGAAPPGPVPIARRRGRDSEVRAIPAMDERTMFAIVGRPDGLFAYHVDRLVHDEELDVDYWSMDQGAPRSGLFASADEAEREIRQLHARLLGRSD